MMNDVASFISTVGFPIFVAVWMLYKTSKDSEKMNESINELKNAITLLTNEMRHHNGDKEDE